MRHSTKKQLLMIAMQHIPAVAERGDLAPRNTDDEDFIGIAGSLTAALEAAYKLGKQEAES